MKIGLLSDLHLETHDDTSDEVLLGMLPERADVIVGR